MTNNLIFDGLSPGDGIVDTNAYNLQWSTYRNFQVTGIYPSFGVGAVISQVYITVTQAIQNSLYLFEPS